MGRSRYRNPLYCSDLPDPDAIRVGRDFYMVTSSFNLSPGLPVYRSHDLVHWRIVSHALETLEPEGFFAAVRPGMGCWAPAIRFRDGRFMVYFPDPDHGLFVVASERPEGPWSKPRLLAEAKGWIDPCPFWASDGRAFLVRAWAKSRSGIKSRLVLHRMSSDGLALLDEGREIFDGTSTQPTIEGPKMYERNGYYYVFAPAGGVAEGWQTVLRSRDPYGPYEERIVMRRGSSQVNGPHQGAWVELESGEHWFLHFQDRGCYGRVLHLQPMSWKDNWPVIGRDSEGTGCGEPVESWDFPDTGNPPDPAVLHGGDDFDGPRLMPQWSWQANPDQSWHSLGERPGWLRLRGGDKAANVALKPSVLVRKFPAEAFSAAVKADLAGLEPGSWFGFSVVGRDCAGVRLSRRGCASVVTAFECRAALEGGLETETFRETVRASILFLRAAVEPGGVVRMEWSEDGVRYREALAGFAAREGSWIGSCLGLDCTGTGFADVDWFRFDHEERNPVR